MAQAIALPANKYVEAIHGTVTHVTSRCEIYEPDGTSLWRASNQLGLLDGDVSVDSNRDERRQLNLTLDNSDNDLNLSPGGLWYDKVVRVYRGVTHEDGSNWEAQLGEFLIDDLNQANFPNEIELSARDFSKKLKLSKFNQTTIFLENQPVEELIRSIAYNGGIPHGKMYLPLTGKSTGRRYTFDRTLSRWEAIQQIANDYAFDIYFDRLGILRLETFTDPYLDPPQYTFQTGPDGNLADFKKSLNDSRIYNVVVVTGGAPDTETPPPYAVVKNENPSSPTSVQRLGERTYFYTSEYMTTQAQCQAVAEKFIKIHALEQFDCSLDAIVIPYLEAGITVNFFDPQPAAQQPTKYLLSNFTIPLGLSSMSTTVKRVIQVN